MPDEPVTAGPWQYATGGLALALALSLAWGARVDSLRHDYKVQRDTARDTILTMDAEAKATEERWERKAEQLAAKAKAIEKDVTNEIARINADRDAALDELRARPSRDTPAVTTTIAGNCTTPVGGTGAFLFREDAEFLTREAARADRVRTSLKACYAHYDDARAMLAGESR